MALLKLPKPRGQRPGSHVPLNWGNPLNKGLKFGVVFNNLFPHDLVTNTPLTKHLNDGTMTYLIDSDGGVGVHMDGTTLEGFSIPSFTFANTDPWTITMFLRRDSDAANDAMMVGEYGSNNDYIWLNGGSYLRVNNGATNYNITGDGSYWTNSTVLDETSWISVTGNGGGATGEIRTYHKGVYRGNQSSASAAIVVDTIGVPYNSATFGTKMWFGAVLIHNRALSDVEIKLLHTRPWEILQPTWMPVWDATAATGITETPTPGTLTLSPGTPKRIKRIYERPPAHGA